MKDNSSILINNEQHALELQRLVLQEINKLKKWKLTDTGEEILHTLETLYEMSIIGKSDFTQERYWHSHNSNVGVSQE